MPAHLNFDIPMTCNNWMKSGGSVPYITFVNEVLSYSKEYCYCIRYDDPFVVVAFDSAPTADSETFNKLDQSIRDAHESQVSFEVIYTSNILLKG